ncbi:MAG: 4a-hydroxytetrahydrobiopterin dehydratase [bacterium]
MTQRPLNLSQLQQHLDALNQDNEQEWAIIGGKLHKTFSFKNFVDAFGFMTRAAIHAEKDNHHPEWSNVYRTVVVDLVTHEAGGITELDFKLAEKMDTLV